MPLYLEDYFAPGRSLEPLQYVTDEVNLSAVFGADEFKVFGQTMTASVNAQGDFSLDRTAGGAETLYWLVPLPKLLAGAAGKGIKVRSIEFFYELSGGDPTSIDVVADSTKLAHGANPVVTNNLWGAVADNQYDANHNTAAKRVDSSVTGGEHHLTWTPSNPDWITATDDYPVVALKVVLAVNNVIKCRRVVVNYTMERPTRN